jgi:hypothetical protein
MTQPMTVREERDCERGARVREGSRVEEEGNISKEGRRIRREDPTKAARENV